MRDTDLQHLERVRAKLERDGHHVMAHAVQDAKEEIIASRAGKHPIDQLWGRFDEVSIHLCQSDDKSHYWRVVLYQTGVTVMGHPNDPNIGEIIAQAIKEVEARQHLDLEL